MAPPTTFDEICSIARTAIEIFATYNLKSCLFGSTACALYGTTRLPNDVDLVVFSSTRDQEALKQLLTQEDENFFLVPSRNRRATYEVLWYRLPRRGQGRGRGQRPTCKVDILIPGILSIPHIPARLFEYASDHDDLPIMPILPLLMLKLQGWTDHRDSHRQDFIEKQYDDADDINELLEIAAARGDEHLSELRWVTRNFKNAAQNRVFEFIDAFADSAHDWMSLGFEI